MPVHHGSLTAAKPRPKIAAPELEILTVLVGFRPENYRGDRGKLRDKRWKAQLGAWFRGEEWFDREVRETLLIAPRRSVS
jgi:hypothetical protein